MATDKIQGIEIHRTESREVDLAFSLAQEYFTVIGVMLREDRKAFIEEYFGGGKGFWLARVDGELAQEYFTVIGVMLREDRKAFIEEYFGDGKGFWLSRVDGELAGCIGLRRLRLSVPPDGQVTDCAEIKRMYVREKFRGQGIAQRLLETAEQFARNTGYPWIYLDTTNEMKAAAKLYERNGFLDCERYNQNPQAAIFMRKKLSF